jgi:hypothetical protein
MEARNKHKGNNPCTAKRYNLSQTMVLGAPKKERPLAPAIIHFSLSSAVASKIVVILGGDPVKHHFVSELPDHPGSQSQKRIYPLLSHV